MAEVIQVWIQFRKYDIFAQTAKALARTTHKARPRGCQIVTWKRMAVERPCVARMCLPKACMHRWQGKNVYMILITFTIY